MISQRRDYDAAKPGRRNMKTLVAGVLIAGLAISAQLALAGTPAPASVNCPASANASSVPNKLLGGLSHGTERTAAGGEASSSDVSGSAGADGWTKGGGAAVGKTDTTTAACASADSGSIPTDPKDMSARSGVALTVQGNNFTADSASN